MSTLQHKIARAFLDKLRESDQFNTKQLSKLEEVMLNGAKKPKPDDFVSIYRQIEDEDLP